MICSGFDVSLKDYIIIAILILTAALYFILNLLLFQTKFIFNFLQTLFAVIICYTWT